MISQKATIVAIHKKTILIKLLDLPKISCTSTCSSKKIGCQYLKDNLKILKTTTLLRSSKKMNIQVGDLVIFSMSRSKEILLKLLLYGLPLCIAALGYKFSLQIPEANTWITSRGDNWIAIVAAIVSFISSFYILSLFNGCLFRLMHVRILNGNKK